MLVRVTLFNGQVLTFVVDTLPTDPWTEIDDRAREVVAERHPILGDQVDYVESLGALS